MSSIELNPAWESALEALHFAFQPIVLASDGRAYGYEALLRGCGAAGFPSIGSAFDSAYLDGALAGFDERLREKAFGDFARWAPSGTKLFYNIDNRIFLRPDAGMGERIAGGIVECAEGLGLSASRVALEISERHELEGDAGFERVISLCREKGLRIAIDDFGSGYAGLKLLHMSEPDIVKIDRHFVSGCGSEPRKARFLEKIVGMAHLMGVSVVVEGVETESELGVCLESGCDMVQGFLLARPTVGREAFAPGFDSMARVGRDARRGRSLGAGVLASAEARVSPARDTDGLVEILSRFRKNVDLDLLPVVDEAGEPVGVYLERDFRQYVYSPYGIALLEHLESGRGRSSFLRRAPIAALGADLARVLEVFSAQPSSGGVILTADSRYAGLVPAAELLALVAERELAEARDQNPLTRLPGNLRVAEVISQRMAEGERGRAFVYFDFDDFKPFNDRYGFRLGDRMIQLFADILRSTFGKAGCFVGHLGGDDFFAFSFAESIDGILSPVREASDRFRREASSFYSAEDRDRGWILGRDRSGIERRMPLIGVSAAVVLVERGSDLEPESLSDLLAALKKEAKGSPSHCAHMVESAGAAGGAGGGGALPRRAASTESGRGPAFAVFAPALLAST
jgi:diguanylate cyclase (GGDEF)-like protein